MKNAALFSLILFLFAAFSSVPALAQEEEEETAAEPTSEFAVKPETRPWALRDSYSFNMGIVRLYFFTDDGELYVTTQDERVWLEGSNFEIVLGNGDVIRGNDLDAPYVGRVAIDDPLGSGLSIVAKYPPKNGLTVSARISRFETRGFLLFDVVLTNDGVEPIVIDSIKSMIVEPGKLKRLGPGTKAETKLINTWDGVTLFEESDALALILVKDYGEDAHLGLAMLPRGMGEPVVTIRSDEGSWHGEISTDFGSPRTLQPGETLSSNPTVITIGAADTAAIEESLSWTMSQMPGAATKPTGRRVSTRPAETPETPAAAVAAEEAEAPLAEETAASAPEAEGDNGIFKRFYGKVKDTF